MTKRAFFSVLFLCLIGAFGAPMSFETAQKTADSYLRRSGQSTNLTLVRQKRAASPFFIFSKGAGKGYVIVSADNVAAPIFCDADEGDYNENNMPPAFLYLMRNYEDYINDAIKNRQAQNAETKALWEKYSKSSNQSRGEIRAKTFLMTSKWDQYGPYWNQTPIDPRDSKQSLTGCVATSMAQVIYYHKYPAQGKGAMPSYTPEGWGSVSVPSITHSSVNYNYSLMIDSAHNASPADTKAEIAKLMRNCGVSVGMNYRSSESTARDKRVYASLRDYFDYDNCIRFVDKNPPQGTKYPMFKISYDDWKDLIVGNIENKSPVIISNGAHNFVMDGYDPESGMIHANMGYGNGNGEDDRGEANKGYSNQWFSDIVTYWGGTNAMTINIMPNKNGAAPSVFKVTNFSVSASTVDISAKMIFGQDFNGKIGIAQVSGNTVSKVLDSADFSINTKDAADYTYLGGVTYGTGEGYYPIKISSVKLNKNGFSGDASNLKVVTRRGSGEWSIVGAAQSEAPTPPTPATVKITFDSKGGSNVAQVEVERGTPYTPAAVPTQNGFIFVGWCTNSATTTKWIDATAVNSDMTLYAKWTIDATAISEAKSFDGRHGIVAVKNPVVGDLAEFVVKTPESWTVAKLTIYDNAGNVVFFDERRLTISDDRMKWDLRNANARAVAAGTYLAVVECQGANNVYRYYAKFGVKK